MWALVIKTLIQIGAGIGIADLMDRFVKPQVPAQYYPEPVSPGLKPLKILWLGVAFVAAFMIIKWLAKTMKIQILK